jgi:hypothetical protein
VSKHEQAVSAGGVAYYLPQLTPGVHGDRSVVGSYSPLLSPSSAQQLATNDEIAALVADRTMVATRWEEGVWTVEGPWGATDEAQLVGGSAWLRSVPLLMPAMPPPLMQPVSDQ